jgi:hypothetical protein
VPKSIPAPLAISMTAFGFLFFAGHLIWAVVGVRSASGRDDRLELAGRAVPGIAGLLLAVAVLAPWPLLGIGLVVMAMPVMVLGRAIYESIVFRRRGPDGR